MPAPVHIARRDIGANMNEPTRSPLLHPALSTSLSRSFGHNSPFSLSALSSSLTMLSSSPSFSNMGMSLGRSFEERPKLEAQFFRNFSCCGLDLQDLHGLLEHFEECHVAFDDPDLEMDLDNASDGTLSGGPPSPRLQHSHLPGQDAAMDFDMDLGDVPPPPAPIPSTSNIGPATTSSTPATNIALTGQSSSPSATSPNQHIVGGPTATLSSGISLSPPPPGHPHHHLQQHLRSHHPADVDSPGLFGVQPGLAPNMGLPPSLLYPGTTGSGADGSPVGTPGSDEADTPLSEGDLEEPIEAGLGNPHSDDEDEIQVQDPNSATTTGPPASAPSAFAPLLANQLSALHPLGQGVQISPSGRPYTPPSEKPFKCSVPGCDKSYKQQNGLKYHRLHGHCNQNALGDDDAEGKPYVCHVTSCGKRYKNMNGLRYHYQHSGAHGALGLQMLAQAVHPPPQYPPGHRRAATTSSNHSHSQPGSGAASPIPYYQSAASSRDSSPVGFAPSRVGVGVPGALGLPSAGLVGMPTLMQSSNLAAGQTSLHQQQAPSPFSSPASSQTQPRAISQTTLSGVGSSDTR